MHGIKPACPAHRRAACTPEFYVFNSSLKLEYHGQFDDARPKVEPPMTVTGAHPRGGGGIPARGGRWVGCHTRGPWRRSLGSCLWAGGAPQP